MEAKYPALLFKQQLDAFVQKIFPMLRDNVKKEITPQLAACIHAPRAAGARGARRTTSGHGAAAAAAAAAAAEQPGTPTTPGARGVGVDGALSPHWGNILRVFDALLRTLRDNHVPPFLVQKLFEQLLSFVNVQLFNQVGEATEGGCAHRLFVGSLVMASPCNRLRNSRRHPLPCTHPQLLLRRECCSFSNGEYVKAGLSEVEQWISNAGEQWVSAAWGGGGPRPNHLVR